MSFHDDPLSDILKSRRIPHSSASRKGGRRQAFDPLAAIGSYEVLCKADGIDRNIASWMTIHGLNEDDSALIVSMNIGKAVEAMAILAGSRKVMKRVVDELEIDHDHKGLSDECDDVGGTDDVGREDDISREDMDDSATEVPREEKDDLDKRRADTFEKNSFRNPKFWMCWRGIARRDEGMTPTGEKNTGYLIWKNNRCEQFEGTMSCDTLGWNNVKIKGHRIRKGAAECHLHWTDIKLTEEIRS